MANGPGVGLSPIFVDQIEATIIRSYMPNIIYPSLTNKVPVPGSVRAYTTIDNGPGLTVQKVTTGGEPPSTTLEFTRHYVAMDEAALAPRIYDNDINDGNWDIIQLTLEEIGRGMAKGMNDDYITALATSVASTSYTTAAGANWSAADADPLKDIVSCVNLISGAGVDATPNALILNNTNYNEMILDPNFMSATARGDRTVTEGAVDKVHDLNVFKTTSLSHGTAYVTHTTEATNYYEREPLTTEIRIPERIRAKDILAWARYAFAVVRGSQVAQLTGI